MGKRNQIIEESAELAHWIAAPMKDVGTLEQFHEVVDRAQKVIDQLRAREEAAHLNAAIASNGGKNASNNNG